MPLQPAYETVLRHGDRAVTLRASLRAAVALDQLPGGIPGAWEGLMRQSYSGIRQVILATATDRAAAYSVLSSLSGKPLASFLGLAQAACLDLLMHLLPEPRANARPDPGATVHGCLSNLFLFGTVYAQWPPAEVWNASARELQEIALASVPSDDAVPGDVYTPERLREIEELGFDPAFDRNALRQLKARHKA